MGLNIKARIQVFFAFLKRIIAAFFALIYDYAVTYPVTRAIYLYLIKNRFLKDFPQANLKNKKSKGISMIDIGCASGTCLKSVLDKANFSRVLAIDINKQYLTYARKKFEKDSNVEVKLQDFTTYLEDGNTQKFDVVFFGFSFMLMPDKAKALAVAKRILKPGGKIYAFLTLYEKKNKFVEWIKPKMVKFTSIEFGEVMYRKQLYEILKENEYSVGHEKKLAKDVSFVLSFFNIWAYEFTPNENVKKPNGNEIKLSKGEKLIACE